MERSKGSSVGAGKDLSVLDQLKASQYGKTILIATGGALAAILFYGIYRSWSKRAPMSTEDKIDFFIEQELARLRNLELTDMGALQKKAFFDVILLIKLKTSRKLNKEVGKNQRERVKALEEGLQTENKEILQIYFNKTITIFEKEFDQYEVEFNEILSELSISQDVWEVSNELYINNNYQGDTTSSNQEQPEITEIETKIYEFLQTPPIPKSLTRSSAKQIMIDANERAKQLYRSFFIELVTDPYIEPLFIETVGYDLVFLDYGFSESVFRYAAQKYDLKRDPEVKEYLDNYYQTYAR